MPGKNGLQYVAIFVVIRHIHYFLGVNMYHYNSLHRHTIVCMVSKRWYNQKSWHMSKKWNDRLLDYTWVYYGEICRLLIFTNEVVLFEHVKLLGLVLLVFCRKPIYIKHQPRARRIILVALIFPDFWKYQLLKISISFQNE